MYRPGGMSSDDDSDWDDDYYSHVAPTVRSRSPPIVPTISLEEQLLEAVIAKDVGKVKSLLDEGADVNFSPPNNWNAILQASYAGCYEIVELLVEKGADVNSSHEKFTPLLAVCSSTNRDERDLVKCLNLLIDRGAKVNICDWYRISPLSHAVRKCHNILVSRLIEEGADVDVTDQDGWSPIFYAVDLGKPDFVSTLINAGANIYLIEKKGSTLLDIALEKENFDVIKLLSGGIEVDKWIITEDSDQPSSTYLRVLSMLPSLNDRLSGFRSDLFKILNAVQLPHLNQYFYEKRNGLGHLLTSDDENLKEIGIKFWFERSKIIRTIEKFHEYPWSMSSFGSVVAHKELDLFQVSQLMATLTRQLYLISVSSYWWVKQGGIDPEVKTLPSSLKQSLTLVKVLRRKIKSLQVSVKKIDDEDCVVPSDLILPLKGSHSSSVYKVLFTCVSLVSVIWISKKYPTISFNNLAIKL